MSFGQGVVSVCGSRSLPASAGGLVWRVVASLLASGRGLAVGCATGADALALTSALQAGAQASVSVFVAFGPGGQGACRWSSVEAVSGFEQTGGRVVWWAGGAAGVPLAVRLRQRTLAVAEAGQGGLVAFLGHPGSAGSLLACRQAASAGVPVVAFPVGFNGARLASIGSGHWVPVGGLGVWSGAWRWVAYQGVLF